MQLTVQMLRDLPGERRCVNSGLFQDRDARLILILVNSFQLLAREQRVCVRQPSLVFWRVKPQRRSVSLLRLRQTFKVRLPERCRPVDILQRQIKEANRLNFERIATLAEHWVFSIGQSIQIRQRDRMGDCGKSSVRLDGSGCSPMYTGVVIIDNVNVGVEVAPGMATEPFF